MTTPMPKAQHRRIARWPACKKRFKMSSRGRPPTFCGRSCRRRAYERRKWSSPHPVELLARDIASVRVRAFVKNLIREVLLEAGITVPPPPPLPKPKRRPSHLHVVEGKMT